jgi:threonine synthase
VEESAGLVDEVSDEEILAAQRWLAREEGIFVEPASAAPIAGLLRACDANQKARFTSEAITEGQRIVCTVTGHGLKDPEIISVPTPTPVAPDESAVLRALDRSRD